MSKELRGGYTTGACAAAGAKAAVLYMQGEYCQSVRIIALDGTPLDIPVKNVEETSDGVCAEIVKFSGDDPDITNGVSVFTTVKMTESGGIVYKAGEGIGHVTKAGLSVPVGEPSINPGPRKLIAQEIYKLFNKKQAESPCFPSKKNGSFLSLLPLFSTFECLTSVFEMGTGISTQLSPPFLHIVL